MSSRPLFPLPFKLCLKTLNLKMIVMSFPPPFFCVFANTLFQLEILCGIPGLNMSPSTDEFGLSPLFHNFVFHACGCPSHLQSLTKRHRRFLNRPLDQLHSPQLGMVETNNSNAKKFWILLFRNPTINNKLEHPHFESSSLP